MEMVVFVLLEAASRIEHSHLEVMPLKTETLMCRPVSKCGGRGLSVSGDKEQSLEHISQNKAKHKIWQTQIHRAYVMPYHSKINS